MSIFGKGKQVNSPVLARYAWQHKSDFRRFRLDRHCISVNQHRSREYYYNENASKAEMSGP